MFKASGIIVPVYVTYFALFYYLSYKLLKVSKTKIQKSMQGQVTKRTAGVTLPNHLPTWTHLTQPVIYTTSALVSSKHYPAQVADEFV